jgi:soluble lytic murein transglycosylase-like protein
MAILPDFIRIFWCGSRFFATMPAKVIEQYTDMKISTAFLMCACLCAGPVAAQDPAPFPEFQAKRVKPPKAGTRKRITVQITEPAQARAAALDPKGTAQDEDTPADARHAWFWKEISPALDNSGPGRLAPALTAIRASERVAAPRLQMLQDIAGARGVDILKATIGTRVSPALVLAVIAVESSGRADAVSGAGAQGLMQLMPDTAARFGVEDSLVAADNIQGGVRYLDWLLERFSDDPILALAGYNAGEGAVSRHEGVPPFAETRDYVPKVLAAFDVARGLCLTPPELISDGCVFVTMQQQVRN